MKKRRIIAAINRYGDDVVINIGGKKPIKTKAFFEPLLYKNKMYVRGTQVSFGYSEGGRFMLICPYVGELSLGGVVVEHRGEKFYIQRADNVYLENKILYTRSILAPYMEKKGDAYE